MNINKKYLLLFYYFLWAMNIVFTHTNSNIMQTIKYQPRLAYEHTTYKITPKLRCLTESNFLIRQLSSTNTVTNSRATTISFYHTIYMQYIVFIPL